jgi:hypothetical protein
LHTNAATVVSISYFMTWLMALCMRTYLFQFLKSVEQHLIPSIAGKICSVEKLMTAIVAVFVCKTYFSYELLWDLKIAIM